MKIDKNDYPIILLEELEEIISKLRSKASGYVGLISERPAQTIGNSDQDERNKKYEYLRFGDDENKSFLFTVDEVKLVESDTEQPSKFFIYVAPRNEKSVSQEHEWMTRSEVINSFEKWINILKRYKRLRFEDPITKQYEEEIYDLIKIVDDDANTASFQTHQQILLLGYLDKTISHLESKNEEYEVAEIINETKSLKKNLTRLTKSSTMKSLSSILAKSKKKGMDLFSELMTMFKKEVMKKVITSGFENFEKLTSLLENLN